MKKIFILIGFIVCFCFFSEAQVRVNGPVNPSSPLDLYPTHIDSLGHGGFMVVVSKAIRNNIPPLRRKQGMLVYVRETDSVYQLKTSRTDNVLNDTDWDKFKLGSVGGLIWWGSLASAPAGTPALNWAYFNNTDKKTYVYSTDGPLGVPAWNAIATTYELPEVIDGNRTFTGNIYFQGGVEEGPEALFSSTLIKTKLETKEYLLDMQYENRPRFRRYVLGLNNEGMIALVRPHIQMFTVHGEWTASNTIAIPANSDRDIDIEFTTIKPQIGANEEVPLGHKNLDITAGPFVQPSLTYNYDPQSPPSSTSVGFPSGIVVAWSVIMFGIGPSEITGQQARYARVRLRNVTGSPINIPIGFGIRVSAFAVDEGAGAIYESDLPVGG